MKKLSLSLSFIALFAVSACGPSRVTSISGYPAQTPDQMAEEQQLNTRNSSKGKAADQKPVAGTIDKLTWSRGGGGDLQFEVTRKNAGFEIQVVRLNFKPAAQTIEISTTEQPTLTEGLEKLFTRKLELSETKPDELMIGGTFPVASLSIGPLVPTEFKNPEIKGTENKTLLADLEKFVRDSIEGKNTLTAKKVTQTGCTVLSAGALEGTWEEQDKSIGCGWAGTVSTFKLKTTDKDGIEIYEGVDKTESGGIVLTAPKVEEVTYRFDLQSCTLQQTKGGITTTALLTRTKGATEPQYVPSSLELTTCTDATCAALARGANGKAVIHVLKKKAVTEE